jgi:hypothetical protein
VEGGKAEAISPLTIAKAADALKEKGFLPTSKGRPGIIDAARELLQAANNDTSNLSVGASGTNRARRQAYDPGDAPGASATDPKFDPQKEKFIGKYGFAGTDFNVTVAVFSDGNLVETWEITP